MINSDKENIIDILEDKLVDNGLLDILLLDRTTGKNIIWATDNYESASEGTKRYRATQEITVDKLKRLKSQIKPRCIRAKEEQSKRTKEKAEVFTPSWICNKQNNSIDNQYGIYFNDEKEKGWENSRVDFSKALIDWKQYVDLTRLEITCGEAPYLVSRYDTVSGEYIPVNERIGMLDRKLQVINHYINEEADWIVAVIKAYRTTYGYEWQGDSLLIARENLLATLYDFYEEKFGKDLDNIQFVKNIAEIISWNLWQMDGLKGTIPLTCSEPIKKRKKKDLIADMEDLYEETCPGCKLDPLEGISQTSQDTYRQKIYQKNSDGSRTLITKYNGHNGILCKIMNWETGQEEYFVQCVFGENEKNIKKENKPIANKGFGRLFSKVKA